MTSVTTVFSRRHAAWATLALLAGTIVASAAGYAEPAAQAASGSQGHDHDYGEMIDPYAQSQTGTPRTGRTFTARTVSVSPSEGPDFEMPFRCGETWVGSTRSTHSPSRWSIDFNRTGDTGRPVLASARGVVTRVARASGYGNYVIIDHGAGYSSLYAHLQSSVLSVGQVIDQGAVLGYLGSTGRVTGPHLHFEMRLNGNYFAPYFHRTRFGYARTVASQNCPDAPIVGDWDGDGVDDLGILRPQVGQVKIFQRYPSGSQTLNFGAPADSMVAGDWDGNRIDQFAKRSPRRNEFVLRGEDGQTSTANMGGAPRYVPVTGVWQRGARTGLGLFNVATRTFTVRMPDLSTRSVVFGSSGTQPVIGDWDGDGVSDFGSFAAVTGTWSLRTVKNGRVVTTQVRYGTNGDIPVTGDWNGDKVTDLGVWRPSTATFHQRTHAAVTDANARTVTRRVRYGAPR